MTEPKQRRRKAYSPGNRHYPRSWKNRIWDGVNKAGPNGCWLWLGHLDRDGYGQIRGERGETLRVHRAMYELEVGPIPEGLTIDHLCRNKACCNPAHLEAVTHRENILRSTGPAAINAARTHCTNGHEFTPENTYTRKRPGGGRLCRTCNRRPRKEDRHEAV